MMNQVRPLMYEASLYDTERLLAEWRWLQPSTDTPLYVSVFADWVFGNPDGSLWLLSALEGNYTRIAVNAQEFNRLNKSPDWLEDNFIAGWQEIAARHGLNPNKDQCLGWNVHPILGGKFDVANLKLFDMIVYQSIMGQLHRQLQRGHAPAPEARA